LKSLIKSIFEFVKEDFNLFLYLKVIIFTSFIVFLEYKFSFYSGFATESFFSSNIYLINFITFSIAYYGVILILRTDKTFKGNLNLEFWLKSFVLLAIVSLYIGYYGYYGIKVKMPYPEIRYYYYTADNLSGFFTLLIPVFLVYLIFDRNKENPFYGFNFKNFNFMIAGLLIVIAVGISYIGSHMVSVSEYYPILNRTAYKAFSTEYGIPRFISATLFEMAYMFDFVMIELFFRGVMIFGFVKILGKKAILPVATLYAVIHFGKPLPETISSFFGAYVLGIVAYQQKNIGIGVVLHCFLAFAMEIFTIW
jgi:hypothetical protein